MRVPLSVLKLTVEVPAVVGSCLLWAVAWALLPPALGLPALLAGVAVLGLLASGAGERTGIVLLAGARSLTPAEEASLRPFAARLASLDTALGREVLVRRSVGPRTPPAQLLGHDALVVTPWLIEAMHRGSLAFEEAAALVVHAQARRQAEKPRAEVAMLALTLPSRAIVTLGCGTVRAAAWVPAMRLAWAMRGLLGVVAVVQQAAAGRVVVGVLAGAVMALTYLVPSASRAKNARVDAAADTAVVRLRLGPVLAAMIDRHRLPISLERSQRLQRPMAATCPTETHPHLELVRSGV